MKICHLVLNSVQGSSPGVCLGWGWAGIGHFILSVRPSPLLSLVLGVYVGVPQLHLQAELHAAGPVGHRLRHCRWEHPADHPPQHAPLPGPHRRLPGRIVSSPTSLSLCVCLPVSVSLTVSFSLVSLSLVSVYFSPFPVSTRADLSINNGDNFTSQSPCNMSHVASATTPCPLLFS